MKSRNLAQDFSAKDDVGEIVLEARNISRIYGKKSTAFSALKNVSLKIRAGESVAIIGKSGSGKSTLMHILALLDRATSGEIVVAGQNSQKLSQRKINRLRNQEFGFVFQSFFMNARDSVIANVELPLKIAGIGARKRRKMALAALATVELSEKAKNRANDLSGGQKQRVCIARAIVNRPRVIFADEPTGNLDSKTGEKVEKLLFSLNRNKKITLIIVTHDAELAAKCDREIRIKDGEIVEEISRKTGKNAPENLPGQEETVRKNWENSHKNSEHSVKMEAK